jgi:DNA-binding NtrC family response regulator
MFSVLIVEPDARIASRLRKSIQHTTSIDSHRQFVTAKKRMASKAFDFLVTNLRLAEFNGLHLVHLAAVSSSRLRCIVYTSERNQWLAREVQHAGAFYETVECLPVTLAAYLAGTLPPSDRRNAAALDRRSPIRGGRRCWDRYVFEGSG